MKNNLINGRTPEEIKIAIKKCARGICDGCVYCSVIDCAQEKACDILTYIERLESQIPKWISVEEQPNPPEDGEYWCSGYWIHSGRKQAETAEYLGGEWKIVNNFILTHWMPLPESPKEENNEAD